MMKPKVPCRDCTKRFVGCHSTCEEWAKHQEEQKQYKEFVNKKRKTENDARSVAIEKIKIRKMR